MDPDQPPDNLVARNGDRIAETTVTKIDDESVSGEASSNLVNRNSDEITEVKQDDPGQQTAELQGQGNANQSVNAEASSNLVNRNSGEITEVKQGDPGQQTAELQGQGNANQSVNAEENKGSEENDDYARFGPLYKAVLENDWKAVDDFISENPQALVAKVKAFMEETGIHIITRNRGVPTRLLEKIASMVAPESLEVEDSYDRSAIFSAAMNGNTKAAKAFVRRNKLLPNIRNSKGVLPIHEAAAWGREEVTEYLLSVTTEPLDDDKGVRLLQYLINSGFYGMALDLLRRYPELARGKNDRGIILGTLANKPLAFENGLQLGFWEQLIYHGISVNEKNIPGLEGVGGDIENAIERSSRKLTLQRISTAFGSLRQKLYIMFWNALMQLSPRIKYIQDQKLMHMQSLEIVRIMCHKGVNWSHSEAMRSLNYPLSTAAALGIYEIVNEIMKAYFFSFCFVDANTDDVFRLAILHRHEKVFSLINRKDILLSWDKDMKQVADINVRADNILHSAAKFVLSNQVSGAALQMQRELQWFKAAESVVHPSRQEQRNKSNKTPRQVFTDEHKHLVKDGEKWMKETASSCTIVAALIITVVFAAAFTVPGGNNSTTGLPLFLHKPSFLVFVISDALALFSSTASVLMFLGILTSRYAEEDFLESLPKKLIIGLITLFFSIASMMVAFGATIYIFLSHPWKWIIIPISLLGCLPVTLFALLQFPLLVEIYSSTYGTSFLRPRK